MVVIRLTRIGKKKQAFYRVVVADSKKFVNSKFIEILGWYNPKTKEFSIKNDRVAEWFTKGAQPSNTVAKLLKANGVKLPDYVVITEKVSKPKKEPVVKEPKVEAPAVEEAPAETEAPAEDVAQAPAEEAAAETPAEEPAHEEATSVEASAVEAETEAITEDVADAIEEKEKEAEEKAETV